MKAITKTGLAAILLLAISCKKESTIQSSLITDKSSTAALTTDINEPGKYTSVYIQGQRWMTANLAVSRYRNGDRIPQIKRKADWDTLTTGAWCWYNKDSANDAAYGKLYNWYAVHDPRGLAPTGWHIPSFAEWDTLITHLGNNAGGKLKDTGTIEAGTGLWYAPNTGATNKTGFTGLPGGMRDYIGTFADLGYQGWWWSSTQYEFYHHHYAWFFGLMYSSPSAGLSDTNNEAGLSVRCIKD